LGLRLDGHLRRLCREEDGSRIELGHPCHVAGSGGRRYVLDDKTKRTDILDVVDILRKLVQFWRPDKILIEGKAASEDLKLRLLDEMNKGDLTMVTLEEVKVPNNTGKEERLDSCISVHREPHGSLARWCAVARTVRRRINALPTRCKGRSCRLAHTMC
jgi:hypothetical protein